MDLWGTNTRILCFEQRLRRPARIVVRARAARRPTRATHPLDARASPSWPRVGSGAERLSTTTPRPAKCQVPMSVPPRPWPMSVPSPSSSSALRSRPRSSTNCASTPSTAASSSSKPERAGFDMDQAFTALRNHAHNHNLRLVVLAEDVIGGSLARSALDRTAPAMRT